MRARGPIRRRRNAGLGFIPAVAPVIAGSGPAAPIVAAVIAGAAIFAKVFGLRFGPDPRKVPDTQLLEAAGQAFADLWHVVSGERLTWNAPEGSAYDRGDYAALPFGQYGNPDVDMTAALQSAEATYLEARQYLMRPQSVENLDRLYPPWRARVEAVWAARAENPAWRVVQTSANPPAGPAWSPLAIAAAGILGLMVLQEAI